MGRRRRAHRPAPVVGRLDGADRVDPDAMPAMPRCGRRPDLSIAMSELPEWCLQRLEEALVTAGTDADRAIQFVHRIHRAARWPAPRSVCPASATRYAARGWKPGLSAWIATGQPTLV